MPTEEVKEIKINYTKEDLLLMCDRALVTQDKWSDRDSHSSQVKVGELRQLLLCGCEFKILIGVGSCTTDEDTIWIEVKSKGFQYFEVGEWEEETYYLPTEKRLEENKDGDWY